MNDTESGRYLENFTNFIQFFSCLLEPPGGHLGRGEAEKSEGQLPPPLPQSSYDPVTLLRLILIMQ